MKKRIFIIATLLVVAATAFATVSCKEGQQQDWSIQSVKRFSFAKS